MPGIPGICGIGWSWPLARTIETARTNPVLINCFANIKLLTAALLIEQSRSSPEQRNLREVEGGQILRTSGDAVLSCGGERMGTSGASAMRSGCDSITEGAGVAAIRRLETEPWDIDDAFGPISWSSWPQGAGLWWLGR
jgi:hypothetical protein